jgi:hypothetical protein
VRFGLAAYRHVTTAGFVAATPHGASAGKSLQCPSETTSTDPWITAMAV